MNKLVFTWLSQSADAWPDKRALACGPVSYTFAEFEALANRVANTVDALGGRRGDRIGIALEKSAEYVCIQFGILKSGGCYVPIDSAFPATRMFQIIDDCSVEILFTSAATCAALLENAQLPPSLKHIVILDAALSPATSAHAVAVHPWGEVQAQKATHTPRVHAIDADLAYVMYTSGSTGKPKGVMVTHRNILTFMEWCDAKLGITREDRILNTAPFTFDISGLDTFNGVRTGASVHVVKDQKAINSVLTCIESERITFVSTVPTVIGAIVSRPQLFKRNDLTSVKTWISGAAACPAVFMKKLEEFLPGRRLMNIYGPTEATIYCMYYEIDAKTLEVDKPLSIGIPFENTEAFVVTNEGKEAAVGEPGELVLRGTQIAAGYYGNAEKTAAAFRTFPLLPHLGERCYYTGDVARKDEQGNFFFLGRNDDMIKSRGYRIELNEIDIALSLLGNVIAEHTAVAVPDPDVEHLIYAAIVFKEGMSMTDDELRTHCRTRIPEYMIPEKFLFLTELPKTTSGKISRKDIVLKIQQEKL